MVAAAQAGHLEGVGMLVFHLEGQGLQTPQAVKRLYCWLSVEPQTQPGVAIGMTKLILGGQAPSAPQANAKVLNTLERWQPQAKDCVALGLGGEALGRESTHGRARFKHPCHRAFRLDRR